MDGYRELGRIYEIYFKVITFMINHMRPRKWAILFPFIFFAATSMFVRSWVPFLYSSWPTLLLGCLLAIVVVPKFFKTRWFVCIGLYTLVVFLNWLAGDDFFKSFSFVANEIACLFLFSAMIYYLFISGDKKCFEYTYVIMLGMLVIATFGSVYVNHTTPGIVRYQNYIIINGEYSDLISYYRLGMSNYLLPHGLPVLIPPLILLIKRGGLKERMVAIAFLLCSMLLIYLGGSTTAFLLALLAFATLFFNKEGSTRPLLVAIVAIITIPMFFSLLELGFGEDELGGVYSSHLSDLSDYASEGAEGNAANRMSLYKQSLAGFFQNPLIGTNSHMSGHSVVLDRLGSLGLVGFLPFVGILYYCFQFVSRQFGRSERPYYIISFLLGMLMLLAKGIEDKEVWLMLIVVAPVIFYKASHIEKK